MALNRALQHEILEKLAACYPQRLDVQRWNREEPHLIPNMHYLREHGLLEGIQTREIGGDNRFINAQITATGMDFLADDGGLSAILGVVTIKLHDDTIRQLIEARIQTAELPETTKSHLLKSLREAPGETIKLLTEKLLDAGLENWPVALAAIQKFL